MKTSVNACIYIEYLGGEKLAGKQDKILKRWQNFLEQNI